MQEVTDVKRQILSSDGKRLSVSNTRYTNKIDVEAILLAIKESPELESISLENLNIAPNWMQDILQAAAKCPHIRSLSLGGNPLEGKTANILANSLRQWPELEICEIPRAGINRIAADAILPALADKPALQKVNISGNPIRKLGAEHMATLLANTPTLHHMDMEECGLDDSAFRIIGQALANHGQNVVSCDLFRNYPSTGTVEAFADTIINARLRNLVDTPLDDERLNAFCKKNLQKVKHLIFALPDDVLENPHGVQALSTTARMEMADRIPAMTAKSLPAEIMQPVCDMLAALPALKDDLFAQDAQGNTPLDNPQTWKKMDSWPQRPTLQNLLQPCRSGESYLAAGLAGDPKQVILTLNNWQLRIGSAMLRDEQGKATPLLQQLIADDAAPMLFTAANWRGETPEAMREVYHLLPEEQQAAVTNYYALGMELARGQHQSHGVGR